MELLLYTPKITGRYTCSLFLVSSRPKEMHYIDLVGRNTERRNYNVDDHKVDSVVLNLHSV